MLESEAQRIESEPRALDDSPDDYYKPAAECDTCNEPTEIVRICNICGAITCPGCVAWSSKGRHQGYVCPTCNNTHQA